MIRKIEALGYRCLRDVEQELDSFHVLVGPNASGKSTLLDVPVFLGDLLRMGLLEAVHARSPNPENLFWMGRGKSFDVAVELAIPVNRRDLLENRPELARYEVSIGLLDNGELGILAETLWLKPRTDVSRRERQLFPEARPPRSSILHPERKRAPTGARKVVSKSASSENDYYSSETTNWTSPFRLGRGRAALANLPEDEDKFPAAVWVKRTLMEGVQRIALHADRMRLPARPGGPTEFQPDGSNLPFVIEALKTRDPARFEHWLAHLRTALPDIKGVSTVERQEDRSRYLRVDYENGFQAPSWTVSDGTLRLLALTLIAYIDTAGAVYVIEEPENGIHPKAVECVHQALSSTYESQILCASHSNIVLSMSEPKDVLCFAKDADGATDVVRGSEHPALADWRREIDLGSLFAAGVLG